MYLSSYFSYTIKCIPGCLCESIFIWGKSSNFYSDGTKWQTVVPYSCSTKTYSPKIKIG